LISACRCAFLILGTGGAVLKKNKADLRKLPVMTDGEGDYAAPPVAGDEISTLLGSLERQRATLAWKCGGLNAAGLRATVGASSVTLGGLLKHLALIEDHYFTTKLLGREMGAPWDKGDWDNDPDWEWHSAADDSPTELMTIWQDAVNRSRAAVAELMRTGGPEQPAGFTWPDGRTPSLRRVLVDLIEEYARHVGHADLIRESVDGVVGEDPPGEPYEYEAPRP
jgi:Protein of unknown function (DUF664)